MNKKIIYGLMTAAMLTSGMSASAQHRPRPSQNQEKPVKIESDSYLPEKGDFAVGVDLVPLFRTIGGAFNNDKTPIGGSPFIYDDMHDLKPNVSIMGKYMITDNWGIRVNLGIKLKHNNERSYVADDKALYLNPMSESKVVNRTTRTQSGGSLMVGGEYRLGKRKVQGVFGFGALLGLSTYSTTVDYGNIMTEFNRRPTGSDFNSSIAAQLPDGYRPTSYTSEAPNFAAGVYGSVGAEWFVAPKISIGAEVNLSLYGVFDSKSKIKGEGYNELSKKVDTWTQLTAPGNNGLVFGTDNIGGALYMSFYF